MPVSIIRLVGSKNHIRLGLTLPLLQTIDSNPEPRLEPMLILVGSLNDIRLKLLFRTSNVGCGVLIPKRNNMIVPLRDDVFLELRYNTVVKF